MEIFVCFSFLFGYFEIAGQNDPKRRFDFFFFFFKLVSCSRFFCFYFFVFWHYFKSIAKDFQSLAINLASGQCGSGSLLEVNCIPLNCTNVLTSSWKTNFHHPLTHSYPRLLKRKHFLVIQYFKNMWKFKQKGKKIMSTLTRLTWLIHISVLPSNWNLDKIFALTGQLGQVHMAKKIFLIFLHAGRWLFLLLNLWFSSKLVSKMN